MSYLSNLYWKLSNLKNQKSGVEAELRDLRRRKSDLVSLINNLTSVGDNNYSTVNKYANKILEDFSNTLKGTRSVSTILNSVFFGLEKSSGSDGKVLSALGEMRDEHLRINSRISTLEGELSNVNSGINSTNNSIWYEERRIAQEEARRKAEEEKKNRAAVNK